ncbi:MAG: hypothetical protein RR384_08265 [Acidaminococcaceae bacterium]
MNRSVINSEAYREKFEGLPINKNLADALHKEAISILEQRDATAVETMVALDFKTGKKVVSSSSDKEYATSFTRAEMLIFNTYKGKIVLLHNHPLGGRLSHTDLLSAIKEDKVVGTITIGHDGYVGYAEILKHDKNIAEKWREWYNEYIKLNVLKYKAVKKGTDELYKGGWISYHEK